VASPSGFAAYARPMELRIRAAVADDLGTVLQLWRAAAEPSSTDTEPALRALVAHDHGALMVAEDADADADADGIVGTVIAGWDGWRGSVYRLVVAPEHRRSGVARRLVQAAERRLVGMGAQRMSAIVIGSDTRAMGFWSATDWELEDDQVRFVTRVEGAAS
jgi:ribosomal protein S18 acetylase RimI-like enzyme